MLPGYGHQNPNDWGLGFEIRDGKSPHWTGASSSPRTFGHFGQSGTFLWVDPDAGAACVALADRAFGPWAVEAWPPFTDAVLAELPAGVIRRGRASGGSRPGSGRGVSAPSPTSAAPPPSDAADRRRSFARRDPRRVARLPAPRRPGGTAPRTDVRRTTYARASGHRGPLARAAGGARAASRRPRGRRTGWSRRCRGRSRTTGSPPGSSGASHIWTKVSGPRAVVALDVPDAGRRAEVLDVAGADAPSRARPSRGGSARPRPPR